MSNLRQTILECGLFSYETFQARYPELFHFHFELNQSGIVNHVILEKGHAIYSNMKC